TAAHPGDNSAVTRGMPNGAGAGPINVTVHSALSSEGAVTKKNPGSPGPKGGPAVVVGGSGDGYTEQNPRHRLYCGGVRMTGEHSVTHWIDRLPVGDPE